METRTGGTRESFPETSWSSILSCLDPNAPERRARLNDLLTLYWRPVYKFIRASWGKTVEDAKDLAQEFFVHILEDDLVARYRPLEGRFRCFLKGALKNFLAEAHRTGTRLKRGGGKVVVSLDVAELETERFIADLKQQSPEELFDRQWARELMAQSLTRLRAELLAAGKEAHFKVYEAYELAPSADRRPSYADIAASLNLSVFDVTNYLSQVRARLREIVIDRISDYVTSRDELMDEMRELFSG